MHVSFYDEGLNELSDANKASALASGCVPTKGLARNLPDNSILLGHTNEIGDWTGVYRKRPTGTERIARYRDFGRALRHAQRLNS
ncbi:hypothetical protein SR914_25490 [Comamonas testosteroni]|uniref:Uncharacterized protein n=1 Tax=Comamonas testosteroni (strain DSM 14576 / KF-1) TaxID=399795 RepID=B7X1S8_COMTK|nr:hypothetical protein [Comamonas testosteroni]EED68371.1 hypothetical protein CtesDRAFT_PD3318 [Comamonas testosteroni KF-1]EED68434.1 hypothetical protein CtesDRAFT_PD3381 [Comamonas testosteroni KF-1]WQG66464.1 hypothetical protein SR914_25490 [Comamonas testosteroni]